MRIPDVSCTQLPADAYLIDVREDDEWRAGHAPEAVHLPMMQLPERLAEVPREGDVVIVCRSGHRSAEVVRFLLAQGYDNVRNLTDGMFGWAAASRPLVSEDGGDPVIL
ncbi:rhodanese-like domain-containing protein [Rugosimonospora africana]|uniref:Sulfurtransferase n=1 Tax=Rugosimonospora africana TaxID=556532 RepID=A0A8J3QN95_9ACTN|nr:rhodanese-like domain-containing protein [Rugosimonospora africana]GIH13112.1 sulfurtransferase [Rugosimonospora africana]